MFGIISHIQNPRRTPQARMSNFSDSDDKLLVQCAYKYEQRQTKVSWGDIADKMRKSGKTTMQLRMRLKTMKNRFGKSLSRFPAWYFSPAKAPSEQQAATMRNNCCSHLTQEETECIHQLNDLFDERQHCPDRFMNNTISAQTIVVEDNLPRFDFGQDGFNGLAAFNNLLENAVVTPFMSDDECYDILHKIFASVSKHDVHQKAGMRELNMGEISMVGLTKLNASLDINASDVFLDVGAGIGNVVAQLSLQSCAKRFIGVEIRKEVVSQCQKLLSVNAKEYHQLANVLMIAGDIRDVGLMSHPDIATSTILYAFNEVFHHTTNIQLELVCCTLKSLRIVIVSESFCPRHEQRRLCTNEFCSIWRISDVIQVTVSYTSKLRGYKVYRKR